MKRIIIALTMMLATASLISSQMKRDDKSQSGNVEQTLMQMERQWAEAYARRDIATLDRILSDDYVETTEDGVMDKKQYLAQAKSLGTTSESLILDENKMRVYGDTAVSTGRVRWESEPPTATVLYTVTYIKRQGRWQAVAMQLTALAKRQ